MTPHGLTKKKDISNLTLLFAHHTYSYGRALKVSKRHDIESGGVSDSCPSWYSLLHCKIVTNMF